MNKPIEIAVLMAFVIVVASSILLIAGYTMDDQAVVSPTHSFAVDQTEICITPCTYKGTPFTVVEVIDDGSDLTVLLGKEAYPARSGSQALEIAKTIIDGGQR